MRAAAPCAACQAGACAAHAQSEWKRKYLDNFFRGSVKSKGGEQWHFENGTVRGKDGFEWAWLGHEFKVPNAPEHGIGRWDGRELSFDYPEEKRFYAFSISDDEQTLSCTHLAFGPKALRVVRKVTDISIEADEKVEGSEDSWEMFQDVPLPVVLFCVMYTKAKVLYTKLVERRRRNPTRCGKIVLTAGVRPLLCAACATKGCFACGAPESKEMFAGNCCKNCAPKARGICGRCGDPLKGSKEEGRLCVACGLGSRGMNCAKHVFGAHI